MHVELNAYQCRNPCDSEEKFINCQDSIRDPDTSIFFIQCGGLFRNSLAKIKTLQLNSFNLLWKFP